MSELGCRTCAEVQIAGSTQHQGKTASREARIRSRPESRSAPAVHKRGIERRPQVRKAPDCKARKRIGGRKAPLHRSSLARDTGCTPGGAGNWRCRQVAAGLRKAA
eukprot:5600957-Prymnesium_polylepis.1